MKYSSEAAREKAKPKSGFAEPHHVVERKAREAVTRARGDISNRKHFLGQHIFQIGQYYGKFITARQMLLPDCDKMVFCHFKKFSEGYC